MHTWQYKRSRMFSNSQACALLPAWAPGPPVASLAIFACSYGSSVFTN